ncbi:ADP-ribosylglycohydrolase family protein [Cesiribacter sp. SM1]|uniref:ADP-ribosylglycohydrolase family protein n=1 Tax=Cesiribacter sp. SM1 TaxID=2861196 RepID=UPI001CD3EA57|nr:ADP-ribosylglycohydrolase family protein [Cesiribacter sp. SM1]
MSLLHWGEGYWTPHGRVFFIGIATFQAIHRLTHGIQPDLAGGFDDWSNGNGSLIRTTLVALVAKVKSRSSTPSTV